MCGQNVNLRTKFWNARNTNVLIFSQIYYDDSSLDNLIRNKKIVQPRSNTIIIYDETSTHLKSFNLEYTGMFIYIDKGVM